ncbi:hypothetical protein LI328DRAFT_7753 [Trichoderma asperelloides]|nr:hypothetical protein LI328DRAFT_7753 [Trichoderma asperelloides]
MLCFLAVAAWPGLVRSPSPLSSPLVTSSSHPEKKESPGWRGVCDLFSSAYVALVTGDKGGGRQHHRWLALELVAPPSVLLVPLHAAAKCICTGVLVTVAMCVPGTGVQRDGCHQWLIIARRPQTSG